MARRLLDSEIGAVGAAVRRHRERRGLDQQQLADNAGVHKKTVQNIESGNSRAPQVAVLKALADAMTISDQEREALYEARAAFLAARSSTSATDSLTEPANRSTPEAAPAPPADESNRVSVLSADEPDTSTVETSNSRDARRHRHFKRDILIVCGGLLTISVILLLVNNIIARPRTPEASATLGKTIGPTANIYYPMTGASVISPLVVSGSANLPKDTQLWLLLRAESGDPRYFVTTDSPIAVGPSGDWQSRLRLGRSSRDNGMQYRLYAVAAPVGGVIDEEVPRRPKGQYSVRLPAVPADTKVLEEVRIQMAEFRG